MLRLLLISILFAQIPVKPSEGGRITGILKDAEGKPAAGVRIAAVAGTDVAVDLNAVATMSSLGETDAEGRFHLDTVPPGRYYIAAGRVDLPTYYPGTQVMANGESIKIEPGSMVVLGEFVMTDQSIRTPTANDVVYRVIPVQIRVDDGGRLPIYSTKGQTLLWLTRSDGTRTGLQMTGTSIRVPIPSATVAGEFRATVASLPEGYAVKTMMFGRDNVTAAAFKIASGTASGPLLSVELTKVPAPALTGQGVRVMGHIAGGLSVYLSGMPANLYSDGTFEFRNVPPGRHAIAVPDTATSSHALAASIVVGAHDIEGVELVDTEFAIPRLFPGNYNLQIQVPGRTPISRKVTIGDEDVNLDLIVGAM